MEALLILCRYFLLNVYINSCDTEIKQHNVSFHLWDALNFPLCAKAIESLVVLSASQALQSRMSVESGGWYFPSGNVNAFFSYRRFEVRNLGRMRKEGKGSKARDGELFLSRLCVSFTYAHASQACSRSERWAFVRLSFDLIWILILSVRVRLCERLLLTSPGFSCGCHGFWLCFDQLTALNRLRV